MTKSFTTAWTVANLEAIRNHPLPERPVFKTEDCPVQFDGLWLWDFWPAELPDGRRASVGGGELWFALSAPVADNPDARHHVARIRMLHRMDDAWRDMGLAFPDGFTPGSREWSGGAIIEGSHLTLYFTAAGRHGEASPTFEQRIFSSSTEIDSARVAVGAWSLPEECFTSDGVIYAHAREATGSIGSIKAFRDPAWFRDPADGVEYLLFTGSVGGSVSSHSGCIGIARREADGWMLLEPLVNADGINNELERPHMRFKDGRYVLFWSTQSHVFSIDVPPMPTGLYTMESDAVLGPYKPAGSVGLVASNPQEVPMQAYSWWVGADGEVSSFADRLGSQSVFAGTLAPMFWIEPSS